MGQFQFLETEWRDIAEAASKAAARRSPTHASTLPDDHNDSEAETRDYFIDLLLKEAGWPLDQKRDREFPVTGMPNNKGDGFVVCDMLIRCNWVARVLFLADRVALVNQTTNVFKKFLPDASAVNLITEKDSEGRVFVSTYPTMMGLIMKLLDDIRSTALAM